MTVTPEKLIQLKELYARLFDILAKDGDEQVVYGMGTLQRGIDSMETVLRNGQDIDFDQLLRELSEDYKRMYPPRGGLTEFFIWREDFDERVEANRNLDTIKAEIDRVFTTK